MTATINSILHQKNGKDSNLADAHIQCFCHKIMLILSAGLKEINLPTKILTKQNKTLGFVPALGTISKADEPIEIDPAEGSADQTPDNNSEDNVLPDGYSNASNSRLESGDSET
ncbi:hypothetical protein PCASD_04826 [Puccinia coronata f. sp. avenae]|uniref:Uncharacterized protein n=1 Tax=Puccinia coronata f. sp. avenae TaxID=200324 RepID=A0A2N5V1Z1_9BASI|nr:hypothetical protein PCASD_12833 [Puccinia coronata f. sp. avenae]PLW44031.1 hypothetical protein PCASD_04826 [Puccinia coronata f. sp. avenae]